MEDEALTTKKEEKEVFSKENYVSIIDRLKKASARIAPFFSVSSEVYEAFSLRIDEIRKKYVDELNEYNNAFLTNELTLSCNPEYDLNIRNLTLNLEKNIEEYNEEYEYLSLKQRLEKFLKNISEVYMQFLKKKKKEQLYTLVEKADKKLSEICLVFKPYSLGSEDKTRKGEITSLICKSKYLVIKCKMRLNACKMSDDTSLFKDEESLAYEYLSCAFDDVKMLETFVNQDLKYHPMLERVNDRITYLKMFGFKSESIDVLNLGFFERLFYVEDLIFPKMSKDIKDALELIYKLPFLDENSKLFIALLISCQRKKITLKEIMQCIILFSNGFISQSDVLEDVFYKLGVDGVTFESNNLKNVISKMCKQYSMPNNTCENVHNNRNSKYYYAFSASLEDIKKCKKALDRASIKYKIKEEGACFDVYLIDSCSMIISKS